MALEKSRSISTLAIKFLWILFLVIHKSNLVICDELEADDNLKNALEAIERRQKNLELQENEYHGQPENIGYGFHKTLGFFDSGPATELGSFDSNPKNDNDLQNLLLNYENFQKDAADYGGSFGKRKSNFRERTSNPRANFLVSDRDSGDGYSPSRLEYLQVLKNLWAKYRQSRPEDINIEDLTDEQVQEILNSLYDEGEERFGNDYGSSEANSFDVIPVRSRKNYRVFERFGDKRKRYPSFGEGIYGKRNLHTQNINYENPSENDFLYSLKYVSPEFNREAVENLREEGFEVLGDEKDKDILRMLNSAVANRPKYSDDEEPFWARNGNNYEDDVWLQGPVTFSDGGYDDMSRNEKRNEPVPRFFKNHNGIHLNTKRFPMKRSSVRVRKEAKSEKVLKELKGIFGTTETTTAVSPKKTTTKKPAEAVKKLNATKPEVTKHHEEKKIVRRAGNNSKEQVPSVGSKNQEIADIFSIKKKKSIDWSKYFGIDKRSSWLKNEYLRRAEGHLMASKAKRLHLDRSNVGNVNFPDRSQYEMPFDTRNFNKKSFSYDITSKIDKVENKIGDIEEKIIDDAVKYTGAHSGTGNEDIAKVKGKVMEHLEAAYSLEKMKSTLEEFKNLIRPGKSVAGEDSKASVTDAPKGETRTTVSKVNINSEKKPAEKPVAEATERVATKKKGVKNIFNPEVAEGLEFLNDGYGNRQYEDESCPVLDKILHNCLRVEEVGGRFAEMLVPLCSLQQICYFCGPDIGFSKMSMCDSMYLSEAQNICQGDSTCLINAKNSMLALQDLYEQDLGSENGRRLASGSCLANPCIQRYFFNTPGAIYPLELQN